MLGGGMLLGEQLLLAFRLAILSGWLVVGLALLYVGPRRIATAVGALPGRAPFLAALQFMLMLLDRVLA